MLFFPLGLHFTPSQIYFVTGELMEPDLFLPLFGFNRTFFPKWFVLFLELLTMTLLHFPFLLLLFIISVALYFMIYSSSV